MNSLNQDEDYYKKLILKRFPYLCYSSNLIENFLIIGYDDLMISKKLLPHVKKESENHSLEKTFISSHKDKKKETQVHHLSIQPTILSCISSDYKKTMLDEELMISLTFPNNPNIYYHFYPAKEPKFENIVFFINSDSLEEKTKTSFHGYSFIFYEPFEETFGIYYIPKVFSIISQYPLFNVFNTICKQILQLVRENKLEIPLEILVYNLVNFTPSPMNSAINLNAFPSFELAMYSQESHCLTSSQQQIPITQPIMINAVGGYPVLDFNVYEIFNLLSIQNIAEIFIYSFLESDMLFFSENLEVLNIVMYLFSALAYPCNDTLYLWHIVSVSKREIVNAESNNRFVGKPFASMIGVNCTYNDSLRTYDIYSNHLVVDLDRNSIFIKYDPTDYKTHSTRKEIDQMKKMKEKIEKMIKKKGKSKSGFLKDLFCSLVSKLEALAQRIPQVNTNSLKSSKDISFFNQDITTTENNNNTYTKEFQEIFYHFLLDLMKEYYSFYTLDLNYDLEYINDTSTSNTLIQSKSYSFKKEIQNSSSFLDESNSYLNADISREENLDITRANSQCNVQFKENNEKLTLTEQEFNKMFFLTQKYLHYIKDYLLHFNCFDIYKIQLAFFDEFIILKNRNMINSNFSCFDVIDSFYAIHQINNEENNILNDISSFQKITDINFIHFYEFYERNLKSSIFEELTLYPHITPCVTNESGKQKISFIYKSINFNKDLLLKYVYNLSNFSESNFEQIFPCFKYKSQCQIIDVLSSAIPVSIEEKFIQLEEIKPNDLIIFSTIYTVSYFFEYIQSENELQIILNLLGKINYCFRMYIIILLKGLYKLCKDKINKSKSIHQEYIYYTMIMDLFKEKNMLPNQELLMLIEFFNKNKLNAKTDENEQQLTTNDTSTDKIDIGMFKPTLTENICPECKIEYDMNYFIEFARETYFCGDFDVECVGCGKKMIPSILFKNPFNQKEFNYKFFSPMKIYRKFQELMDKFFQEKLQKDDLNIIYGSITNLLIYFSDFEEDIELPNNFLSKCLVNLEN